MIKMAKRSVVIFAFLVTFIMLISSSFIIPSSAYNSGAQHSNKTAIVWMGLEITGENITSDLLSISAHREELTGVSYEHYVLSSQGELEPIFMITNVTHSIKSFGLETFPMIISANLNDIEYLLSHPTNFISSAVSQAVTFGYTGYNIDFEPPQTANSSVALQYSIFLSTFANALHEKGIELTVDIASWNSFWNFDELNNTSADMLYDMDTYASPLLNFGFALENAVTQISLQKLGVGLITTNVNNGSNLSSVSVRSRFQSLESDNVSNVAVWDMPLNSYWWSYLSLFLGVKHSIIPFPLLYLLFIAVPVIIAIAVYLGVKSNKRKRLNPKNVKPETMEHKGENKK